MSEPGHNVKIEFEGVSKRFEKGGQVIEVLRDIDLSIDAGELVSIVGASGVGKSTLLHLLGTLDRPTQGRLLFNGDDVFKRDPAELAAYRNATIGFVFQFHHLLPGFSALENVMIPSIIAGHDLAKARERSTDALNAVDLEHRLHHQPGELSGGEQQRVAIARALVMEPRVVLADEPSGNLDQSTGGAIHELLIDLNRTRGITLVVVTHNLELATSFPRQLKLVDGKLLDITPDTLKPGGAE